MLLSHIKNRSWRVDIHAMHVTRRLWYWMWGGIALAAKRAFNLRHIESAEFKIAFALLLMGVWLTLPSEHIFTGHLTNVLVSVAPRWAWGILLIIIARYGIHRMLNGTLPQRERAMRTILGCWTFMCIISAIVHPFGIETALLFLMVIQTGILYWQLGTV